VDLAYESTTDRIFVAERADGGGRVLGFNMPTASGNFFPSYNQPFAGASAIFAANAGTASRMERNQAPTAAAESTMEIGTIFPLPAKTMVHATIISQVNGVADFLVFDVNGRAIGNFNYELFEGQNKVSFDISNYPAGYYYLNVIEPAAKSKALQVSTTHKFLKID